MTYLAAARLQEAVYQRLSSDIGVVAEVGEAIYDALPAGELPSLYVSLGPEDVRDWSDKTGSGARHDFAVSVMTEAPGFQAAKRAAAAIADALLSADLALPRGRVIALHFRRARARRAGNADWRRIDLSFRAFVAND